MKVSELEGAQLDYWVGKASGVTPRIMDGRCVLDLPRDPLIGPDFVSYEPSKNWTGGGPIIEREAICVFPWRPQDGPERGWAACMGGGHTESAPQVDGFGSTYLIAAMRAFVASKYGESVDDLK